MKPVSLGVGGLEAGENSKKIAFYQVMEGTEHSRYQRTSPGILQYIAWLEKMGHLVDYFTHEHLLLDALAKKSYDVIAISAAEPDLKYVYDFAPMIKRADPGVIIAVGGYVTAGVGNLLIQHPAIDIVVEGEGEYNFPLVLKDLERAHESSELATLIHKSPLETYYRSPIEDETASKIIKSSFNRIVEIDGEVKEVKVPLNNVYIKSKDGSIHFNPYPNEKGSVTDIAPIQGELNKFLSLPWYTTYMYYSPGFGQQIYTTQSSYVQWINIGLMLSRGCSGKNGKCVFCSTPTGLRFPDESAVIDIIGEAITKFKDHEPTKIPHNINFLDDSFFQNRNWAINILRELKRKGYSPRIGFSAQGRVVDFFKNKELDTELLDAIAKDHFSQEVGVETLHPDSAEYMGKVPKDQGKKYVRMAKEHAIESLRRNIPTTFYAITIHPESTIESIADDYVEWAGLARECYEKTGRIFKIHANQLLHPHSVSKLTVEKTGFKNSQPIFITSNDTRNEYVGDGVSGDFYIVVPRLKRSKYSKEKDHVIAIFNPLFYALKPEVRSFFLKLYNETNKGDIMSENETEIKKEQYSDYILEVGKVLLAYGEAERDVDIQKKANKIIEDMKFVMSDSLEKRRKCSDEAKGLLFDAFYGGKLDFNYDFRKVQDNITKRFEDTTIKLGEESELEAVMDYLSSLSLHTLSEYSKMRVGINLPPDAFFRRFLNDAYMLLTEYDYGIVKDGKGGYNLAGADITGRLDKLRSAISEFEHISVFMHEHRFSSIDMIEEDIEKYLKSCKKVSEIFERGFPLVWPSGVCTEDPRTGVKTFF